jgi:nucleotide-binding universal stress UspA family protein
MDEDRSFPRSSEQSPGARPTGGSEQLGDQPDRDRQSVGHRGLEPRRILPLPVRRPGPRLVVEADGTAATQGALVWALREAARREGTVVAVGVLDDPADPPLGTAGRPAAIERSLVLDRVEAQVLRAIAETGVHDRIRTCVLDRPVLEALTAAAHGADLVVVGPEGRTLLRPAVPRPPGHRLVRGA